MHKIESMLEFIVKARGYLTTKEIYAVKQYNAFRTDYPQLGLTFEKIYFADHIVVIE